MVVLFSDLLFQTRQWLRTAELLGEDLVQVIPTKQKLPTYPGFENKEKRKFQWMMIKFQGPAASVFASLLLPLHAWSKSEEAVTICAELWLKSSWGGFHPSTTHSRFSPLFSRPLVWWEGRSGGRGVKGAVRQGRTRRRRREQQGWWTSNSSWWGGRSSLLAFYWAIHSSKTRSAAEEQIPPIARLWLQTCPSTPPASPLQPPQPATQSPRPQASPPPLSRLHSSTHCCLQELRWLTTWWATTSTSRAQQSLPVRACLLQHLNHFLTSRNTMTGSYSFSKELCT